MKLKEKNILYFYMAVYPVIPVYLGIGGVSLYVYFNMLFAFVLFIFSAKGIHKFFCRYTFFLILYIISLVISNFVHGNYIYVLKTITSLPMIAISVVYYIRTINDLNDAIDSILRVGFIVGIFGIIESITRFNVFSLFNNMGGVLNYNELRLGLLRVLSFTSQTITYADYASMIACLAFYRMMNTIDKKPININRKFKIIYSVMFINVILTFSRSVILIFFISQVLLCIWCGLGKFVKKGAKWICIFVIVIPVLMSLFPTLKNMVENFCSMFLAVVDDKYAASVAKTVDNTAGIGHRFLLYGWVWSSVKNNLLFGQGITAKFRYSTGLVTKTSIEVQFLYTLYHSGIFAMVSEIGLYVSILLGSLKCGRKKSIGQKRISFGRTCFAMFLAQILSYFAVMQDTVERMFYISVFMLLAYIINIAPRMKDNKTKL